MKRFIAVAAVMCVLAVPAFALSDAEYSRMMKDPGFARADAELNAAYSAAKEVMSKEDFADFRKDQREWLASGRDKTAKIFLDSGYSRVEAYTKSTLNRAEGIRGWLDTIERGLIDVREIDDAYFDNGKGSYLYLSLIDYSGMRYEVSFSGQGDKLKLDGTYDYDNKTMNAEDGGLKATLTFEDADTVNVKVNSAFHRAFSVNAEGTYTRHYGK